MSNVYWSFGWIMIFLTLWNLLAQALYMTLSLATACSVWHDGRTRHTGQPLGPHDGPLLTAAGAASTISEPWHTSDPQQQAAHAGHCSQCDCLAADGNGVHDYDWLRWQDGHVSRRSRSLLLHRDRLFYVVVATGSLVGIGFWGALFPSPVVQSKFFHAGQTAESIRTLLDHGFTTAAIVADALLVRHRAEASALWGALALVVFAGAYSGWNRLVFHLTHHWAYPTIQVKVAELSAIAQVGVYALVIALFPCMFLLWRFVLNRYWRCCEARGGLGGGSPRGSRGSDSGLGMLTVAPLLGQGSSAAAPRASSSKRAAAGKRPVYIF